MNITLEESTTENVPLLLEDLIRTIQSTSKLQDQKDFLYLLIVVILAENNFYPVNSELQVINHKSIDAHLISQWKSPEGIFDATFILSDFKNVELKLIVSPLGSLVLVNFGIKNTSEMYTVCLPLSRYIVSPQASTIPLIFRDLKHFSTTMKNKIIAPVKSIVLDRHGYASASLLGLPEEILFKIIIGLPISSIIALCSTCNKLNTIITNDKSLWHDLYKRDFNTFVEGEPINWFTAYKDAYVMKKDKDLRRAVRAAGSMHDYMDYADYVSYIDNPMWENMIS